MLRRGIPGTLLLLVLLLSACSAGQPPAEAVATSLVTVGASAEAVGAGASAEAAAEVIIDKAFDLPSMQSPVIDLRSNLCSMSFIGTVS